MNQDWHKEIIYQIYPRSFKDSNGDGIGDIPGIIEKLDYLKELGVTALWLSPLFKSPMKDNGYDISDYYSIDPLFGNEKEMDLLLSEAKKRGLKILLDLVVNHTSDQHPWFKEALKGESDPYHDYYVWRKKPRPLVSVFGGSAWERVPSLDESYLHLFAKEQPDLNWANEKLRHDIYKMMNYWLDKGVAGFRMDVIEYIGKDVDRGIIANGPYLHLYLQEMGRECLNKHHAITVGECWSADNQTRLLYTDPARKELSMVFQFDQWTEFWDPRFGKWGRRPFSMVEYRKKVFDQWVSDPEKSWPTLFWDNHDLPRALSYCASPLYRDDAAKMLFGITCFSRGTPFVFQGDEIGMVDAGFTSLKELEDIESLQAYQDLLSKGMPKDEALQDVLHVSRDNARIPMQWEEGDNGGFTTGKSWLPKPKKDIGHSVFEEEKDPNSILSFYKKCLAFRKGSHGKTIIEGSFQPLFEKDEQLWAFEREADGEKLLIIANFSSREVQNPFYGKRLLLSNGEGQGERMKPYAFAIYSE